jgi:hypothetical protein
VYQISENNKGLQIFQNSANAREGNTSRYLLSTEYIRVIKEVNMGWADNKCNEKLAEISSWKGAT